MEKIHNCINCGAPLYEQVCPYCGTRYRPGSNTVVASFDNDALTGTLTVCGNTFDVYLSEVEANNAGSGAYRDQTGRLTRERTRFIHKFTLIELNTA